MAKLSDNILHIEDEIINFVGTNIDNIYLKSNKDGEMSCVFSFKYLNVSSVSSY